MKQEDIQTPETTPELESLLKERQALGWRMFKMMFENIIIFGAPAGIAVWVGLKYEILVWALVVAFILSWIIFFTHYNRILRKVNEVESKIKEERKRAGIPEPEAPGFPPYRGEEEEVDDQ